MDMTTINVLRVNGLLEKQQDPKEVFFQKLAELIYQHLDTRTGIFARKSNWKE